MVLPTSITGMSPSFARFLLAQGQEFFIGKTRLTDFGIRYNYIDNCYKFAKELILPHGRWTYCEGIACFAGPRSPVLEPHAWIFDCQTMEACDPTWPNDAFYFGVPVVFQYIWQSVGIGRSSPVVNDEKHRWPIANQPPEKWRDSRVTRGVNVGPSADIARALLADYASGLLEGSVRPTAKHRDTPGQCTLDLSPHAGR